MAARETRVTKIGIGAEVEKKDLDKFDTALASEVLAWINEVSGQSLDTNGNMDNFMNQLKNGEALCNLANKLQPNSIKYVKSNLAFKQMTAISDFCNWMQQQGGVKTAELFVTVDLYEAMNPTQVLYALFALARNGAKFNVRALKGKGTGAGSLEI